MYDIDKNGTIDRHEMLEILKSIYKIMRFKQTSSAWIHETPEKRMEDIFKKMDFNSDGKVERKEFIQCCLKDKNLLSALTHFK